ncbi:MULTISPECIES: preprotein translocase subunit SecG [Massilia]|uniref:Protein-export membrane protein SecG n=1 Tax=Massilia aurea TaxID=373040 RepID=A0A422QQV8_9BURK|nr:MULTISPECIES: preprotein translocase subunit SecG [Massilia]MDY0963817.1 preprotein translocase subunit SecG [Massilia sp. CFBP9026]RNF32408.1 preprotein translocase subunit SecG [Massilia aurea]
MIWFNLIIVVQVVSALAIIGLVLMQHGKGADMGAAFGSGASGSLFGASGSSNFLSKSTAVAAAIFFGSTLALAYIGNSGSGESGGGVMGRVTVPSSQAPATGIPGGAPAQTAPADVPTLPANSAAPAAAIPATPAAPAPATPAPAAPAK